VLQKCAHAVDKIFRGLPKRARETPSSSSGRMGNLHTLSEKRGEPQDVKMEENTPRSDGADSGEMEDPDESARKKRKTQKHVDDSANAGT